ncbi:MAG: hypothetical protein ACLQIB_51585 [Isosphaeraceae bacterium]
MSSRFHSGLPPGTPVVLDQRILSPFTTTFTAIDAAQTRVHQGRMRFVGLWLLSKERELALYRELGTIPYDNWEAFYRSFIPEAGRPAEEGRPPGPSTSRPLPSTRFAAPPKRDGAEKN